MADGKVHKRIRNQIFDRDGMICKFCGLAGYKVYHANGKTFGIYTEQKNVYISIDHILPVCQGGDNSLGNLQVLCTRCNSKKGRKILPGDMWRFDARCEATP